ncbi:putative DNA single-strand annealing protein [Clavibacter phage CMP1]|uniref:Putative DNA single-strand annealing protein n=1 Tax=Clavibacter phage CMP1 TaxID=686439 RepID=D0U232_9CAUD|nr:putative DNA single-strand annealing protein [Clavibacter phage CMP1]ACY35944.1 putative DNA single-strand annealing protein [Clavibacter phage CMP1]
MPEYGQLGGTAEEMRSATAIAKVGWLMRNLGHIAKDGEGPSAQGSYAYMPTEQIVERTEPLMAAIGLVAVPYRVLRHTEYFVGEQPVSSAPTLDAMAIKWNGKPPKIQTIVNVTVTWRLTNTENAADYVEAESVGEGTDNQDKAVNKAMRGAQKNMLTQVLQIRTGDPDAEAFSEVRDEADGPAEPDKPNRQQQMTEGARQRQQGAAAPTDPATGTTAPPAQAEEGIDVAKAALRGALADRGVTAQDATVISQELYKQGFLDAIKELPKVKGLTKALTDDWDSTWQKKVKPEPTH